MAYDAKVLEVMIASPSDVVHEREIVRDVIAEWNAIHSRKDALVMLPLGWDTHSSPELGGRPQSLINERILDHADVLVGIFWTKLGTPTGEAESGTAEEIQRHHAAGKPVLLYFSEVPIVAGNLDLDQFNALKSFKSWAYNEGLVETFSTKEQFRDDFRRHLQLCLQGNEYLRNLTKIDPDTAVEAFPGPQTDRPRSLSDDAVRVLTLTCADDSGGHTVMRLRHLGGTTIQAGSTALSEDSDRRDVARWEAAIEELVAADLIRDVGYKGEIFEPTHKGFLSAEHFKGPG